MRPSLIPLFGLLLAAPLAAQDPLPVTQLDNGLGMSKYPSVATDGNIIAAVWLEDGTNNLFCSVSPDGGNTWNAATQMDDGTGSSKWIYDYNLAVADGSIYFAWRDQRNGSKEDTYFTASHDAGASWSADLRLDDGDAPGATDIDSVKIAAAGSDVHVIQRIDASSGESLHYLGSSDRGASWTSLTQVDNGGGDVDYEAIACASGSASTVHIAWCDNRNSSDDDLFYSHSHDFGTYWMADNVQLDGSGPGSGDIEGTEIHLSVSGNEDRGGIVSIAWLEDETPASANDEEVHAIVSIDGGHNFGSDTTLQVGFDADNHFGAGHWKVNDAGSLPTSVVAWEDNRSGSDEVYVAVSTDGGVSWSESQVGTGGTYPISRVGLNHIGVGYSGFGFPENPMMSTSGDRGATWAEMDMAQGQQTGDADYTEFCFTDEPLETFVGVWLSDDLGQNQAYAGGGYFTPPSGFSLSITGLVAGGTTTIAVAGARSGNTVIAAYSLHGGGPTNTTVGPVDLTPPINQLPSMTADSIGNASRSLNVPSGAAGISVWLQAVDLDPINGHVLSNSLAEVVG